jgi:small nuclear ribonucleoprotein (snRNP)-like protein
MNNKWFEFRIVLVVMSALTLVACGYSTEELSKDVRASVEETFLEKGYTVTEFTLIKKNSKEYTGVVKAVETLYINTILRDSTTVTVSIAVTVDGKSFVWKVE